MGKILQMSPTEIVVSYDDFNEQTAIDAWNRVRKGAAVSMDIAYEKSGVRLLLSPLRESGGDIDGWTKRIAMTEDFNHTLSIEAVIEDCWVPIRKARRPLEVLRNGHWQALTQAEADDLAFVVLYCTAREGKAELELCADFRLHKATELLSADERLNRALDNAAALLLEALRQRLIEKDEDGESPSSKVLNKLAIELAVALEAA